MEWNYDKNQIIFLYIVSPHIYYCGGAASQQETYNQNQECVKIVYFQLYEWLGTSNSLHTIDDTFFSDSNISRFCCGQWFSYVL